MATTSKIPFSVSARTARLIGRENVSNADGAIIELVKNSHDADADDSYIIFENDSLYIIDNGHGMDDDVIRRAWMTIGTNNKEVDPFSPNKRVKSGAKGIGRFALDRLGECVEMFTLPKGRTLGYRWEIDWSAFETDSSARVEDINATLEEIKGMNLRSHLPSNAKEINFSEGGTILKISKLRDDWGIDALKELFGNLELLVPMVETDSFGITLVSDKFPGDLGNVKPLLNDDFDYSLNATYDSQTRKLSAVITRDELDLELIKKYYMRVFDRKAMSVSPYLLKDFEAKSFQTEYDISEILPGYLDEEDLLSQIGNLQFKFLFAKNSDSASKEDRDA